MPGRVQTRSQNAFRQEAKRIRTRSQTRSDEKPNTFEQEARCVQLSSQTRSNKSQTCSNEKPTAFNEWMNTFRRKIERIRSASTRVWEKREKRSNDNLPAFEREPTRVWTTTFMHSNEEQHAFKRGPSRVWTRTYTHLTINWTRSFHMWNAFALYFVSEGYCTCSSTFKAVAYSSNFLKKHWWPLGPGCRDFVISLAILIFFSILSNCSCRDLGVSTEPDEETASFGSNTSYCSLSTRSVTLSL